MESRPPKLTAEEIRKMRYGITNLVDDIRQPRSKAELVASGAELYGVLADYYFRANNLWSAKGKSIPRALRQIDEGLGSRYCAAFEELFAGGEPAKVVALAEEILNPGGGFLFDGHRLDAPAGYRKPLG
jgi:hypothetical protein